MADLTSHARKLRPELAKRARYTGPPVLIESAQPHNPVVIRAPRDDTEPRTTRRVARSIFTERDRTEPLMTLLDLVAPTSKLFELGERDVIDSKVHIGRDPTNDIVLPDDTISGLHATIDVHQGLAVLRDQTSANGTFVNQERLAPGQVATLESGDCVRLGQRVFYYLTGTRLTLFFEMWVEANQKGNRTGKTL